MQNVKKGQAVWIRVYDVRGNERPLTKTNIDKVGRKYITVAEYNGKFDKDTGVEEADYGNIGRLYFSVDEIEHEELCRFLDMNYKIYKEMSIEALRKIKQIIDKETKQA